MKMRARNENPSGIGDNYRWYLELLGLLIAMVVVICGHLNSLGFILSARRYQLYPGDGVLGHY